MLASGFTTGVRTSTHGFGRGAQDGARKHGRPLRQVLICILTISPFCDILLEIYKVCGRAAQRDDSVFCGSYILTMKTARNSEKAATLSADISAARPSEAQAFCGKTRYRPL
jgi:hypothetical protein